jgi:hypothetical protein
MRRCADHAPISQRSSNMFELRGGSGRRGRRRLAGQPEMDQGLSRGRLAQNDREQIHPAAAVSACRQIVTERSAHELGPLPSLAACGLAHTCGRLDAALIRRCQRRRTQGCLPVLIAAIVYDARSPRNVGRQHPVVHYNTRFLCGLGTSAASLAMKSSGSNSTCVVRSCHGVPTQYAELRWCEARAQALASDAWTSSNRPSRRAAASRC